MDSPTLSQMLLQPRKNHKMFLYPNEEARSNENNSVVRTPSRCKNEVPKTVASAPPNKIVHKSATKSLGIRRRLRSVENSSSPFLGIRKKSELGSPIISQNKIKCLSKTPNNFCAMRTNTSLSCTSVKRERKQISYGRHISFGENFSGEENAVLDNPTTDIPTVGFKTAGNKSIAVSSKAIKAAEALLQQIEKEIEPNDSQVDKTKTETLSSKKRFSDGSFKNDCDQKSIYCLEQSNLELKDCKIEHEEGLNDDVVKDILELNADKDGDPSVPVNVNQESTCSSPVLRSRRFSRRKRIKQNTKETSLVSEPKIKTITTEDNADCSLLNDGLDLELLSVDLNIKFEEQCDKQEHQSNTKRSQDCELKNICTTDSSPTTNCHTTSDDSKLSNFRSILMLNTESQNRPDSCQNTGDIFSQLPGSSASGFNTHPQQRNNETTCITTHKSQNKTVKYVINSKDANENIDDEHDLNEDDELIAQACAQIEEENSTTIGFTTASKKPIIISESAMTKARNIITKMEDEKYDGLCEPGISPQRSSQLERKKFNSAGFDNRAFSGFMTASKKPVVISDAALARANELLSRDADEDTPNFPKTNEDSLILPTKSVEKLTNLFNGGNTYCIKKNSDFKPPNLMKKGDAKPDLKNFDKKLLGFKSHNQLQIAVSDESLLKAAELLEGVFS